MEIINKTPFLFAPIAGRISFPNHSYTLIVKGTFDIAHGQIPVPAHDQAYPTGDGYYPDDIDMTGSLRYESDFAFFKPKADLLLAGHCHSPSGKPVQGCRVGFQVGGISKELYVFGDRQWKSTAGFKTTTEPEVFLKRELKFESSFGGPGFTKNPVGMGFEKKALDNGKEIWPLPFIQDPSDIMGSPKDQPQPVGFGPFGRMWQDRLQKMGTYDDQWITDRWPWFPKDFDWSYFNAASPDMQVDGYLEGDEPLFFENLHPYHSRYESKLPGLKVRCFINRQSGNNPDKIDFQEIKMNLDTLWVDMDAEKLVLVWRGVTRVESEEAPEIKHIYIMNTPLAVPEKPSEEYHDLFLAALRAEDQMWEEPSEIIETDIKTPPAADRSDTSDGEPNSIEAVQDGEEKIDPRQTKETLKKQMQAASALILGKIGIDVTKLSSDAKEKFLTEQNKLFEKMVGDDPKKSAVIPKQDIKADEMTENLSKLGIDMKNIPVLSDKAKSEQVRMINTLTRGRIDMIPPDLAPSMAIFSAILPKFGMDPENMEPFIAEVKKQQKLMGIIPIEETAHQEIPSEMPTGILKRIRPLTREIVIKEAGDGNSFADEDLTGLNLSGLNLSGIDFTGANLTKTNLSGSLCPGAVFKKADLREADLTQTNIEHADMADSVLDKACLQDAFATGADFTGVSLIGAVLTDAVFEKVIMPGAIVEDAKGLDTCFTEAVLSGTSFKNSDLSGTDFSGAKLNDADFTEAILFEASIEGAECRKVNFNHADLTFLRASEGTDLSESTFCKASGKESMWRGANLTRTDFSYSLMEGADFSGACMEEADLTASDMKFARFIKTDLYKARLVHMNLFQGSLEKARLVNTDLSFSNMYGVEFLEAEIKNLKIEKTNLKMTKLSKAGN